MIKLLRKNRLTLLLIGLFTISILLIACGTDESNDANEDSGVSEPDEQSTEDENESDDVESDDTDEDSGDSSAGGGDFPLSSGPNVALELADLLDTVAVLEYTTSLDGYSRIEWLGEDEVDGTKVDKFHVVLEASFFNEDFEIWLDDDLEAHYFMKDDGDDTYSEIYLMNIEDVFEPLWRFNNLNRETLVSGEGEITAHSTEAGTIGSYDITLHTMDIYNNSLESDYTVIIGEHDQFEVYLEYIDENVEEMIIPTHYDITEFELR